MAERDTWSRRAAGVVAGVVGGVLLAVGISATTAGSDDVDVASHEFGDFDPATVAPGEYLNWGQMETFVEPDGSGFPRDAVDGYGLTYNPVTISQWGLQEFSRWVADHDRHGLNAGLAAADWLVENQREDGAWLYTFDHEFQGQMLEAPWVSGMAQGQGISMLVRAWEHTGAADYLMAGKKALGPLSTPVGDGGVQADLDGKDWYEEVPTEVPTFILNGFMFTLLGLHDLGAAGDVQAQSMFDAGIDTLVEVLPRYEVDGGWSTYSLHQFTADDPSLATVSEKYHFVHVDLLRALDAISPRAELADFAGRWSTAQASA